MMLGDDTDAGNLAERINSADTDILPDKYLAEMSKARRKGRWARQRSAERFEGRYCSRMWTSYSDRWRRNSPGWTRAATR